MCAHVCGCGLCYPVPSCTHMREYARRGWGFKCTGAREERKSGSAARQSHMITGAVKMGCRFLSFWKSRQMSRQPSPLKVEMSLLQAPSSKLWVCKQAWEAASC